MSDRYNPAAWYWAAEDNRIFSSAAAAAITPDNAAYKAWLAAGNVATPWPRDEAGAQTDAALQWVFDNAGVPVVVDPAAPPVPASITRRQFFQQLAVQSVITKAEALAAVQTGALPSAMQTLVTALPIEQQFAAEMMIAGATAFLRADGLVAELATAEGWTPAQVDALWIAAAAL